MLMCRISSPSTSHFETHCARNSNKNSRMFWQSAAQLFCSPPGRFIRRTLSGNDQIQFLSRDLQHMLQAIRQANRQHGRPEDQPGSNHRHQRRHPANRKVSQIAFDRNHTVALKLKKTRENFTGSRIALRQRRRYGVRFLPERQMTCLNAAHSNELRHL